MQILSCIKEILAGSFFATAQACFYRLDSITDLQKTVITANRRPVLGARMERLALQHVISEELWIQNFSVIMKNVSRVL